MKAFEEKLIYTSGSRILVGLRQEKQFPFEWHYHDAYEITLVLKGEGQRFVGNSIEAYREGDLVFLPPELAHTWKSAENSNHNEAIYIQFGKNCLGSGTFEAEDFRELSRLMDSTQGFRFSFEKKFESLFQKCLEANGVERVLCLLKLLMKLSRSKSVELSSYLYKTEKDEHSRASMDVLMRILSSKEHMQVPEIAEALNMSESTFRRFIKKNTGRSFIDFTNMIQISEASQLLMESKLSISEVALECGYRNLSHFNRKFKEYKNVTPRKFRSSFS